jgi:hypothetical protein
LRRRFIQGNSPRSTSGQGGGMSASPGQPALRGGRRGGFQPFSTGGSKATDPSFGSTPPMPEWRAIVEIRLPSTQWVVRAVCHRYRLAWDGWNPSTAGRLEGRKASGRRPAIFSGVVRLKVASRLPVGSRSRGSVDMSKLFSHLADSVARAAGHPLAFALCVASVVL